VTIAMRLDELSRLTESIPGVACVSTCEVSRVLRPIVGWSMQLPFRGQNVFEGVENLAPRLWARASSIMLLQLQPLVAA
jgi:hypothetical protein